MSDEVLDAPAWLLLSPDLPASAKLIWMIASLPSAPRPAGTGWLAKASGLARPTVRTSMAHLSAVGCHPGPAAGPAAGPTTVPVPAALLTNPRLGIHARVVYGIIHLTPGFSHPSGRFTPAGLARMAHASPKTVARAVGELVRAEWLKTERAGGRGLTRYEFTFPGFEQQVIALTRAQERLGKPRPFGEALMQEYLSLLVDSVDFEDNARPGFLVNPRTGERLELDRYYPHHRVAFEFNGPHHEHGTEKISEAESVAQQERDLIKLGLCVRRGMILVTVHPTDLTLKRMRQKVANLLPLRDVAGDGLLIGHLEDESRRYMRAEARR